MSKKLVYLTFVSTIKQPLNETVYLYEGEENLKQKTFSGVFSSEPAYHFFQQYCKEKKISNSKIVFLSTPDTRNNASNSSIEYLEKLYSNQPIEVIELSSNIKDLKIEEIIQKLFERVFVEPMDVFIDISGGDRALNYSLLLACQVLKYRGILIKKMLYAKYVRNGQSRLTEVNQLNELVHLIEAIDQFTSTGNAEYFEQILPKKKFKKLLRNLVKFSYAVKLSKVSDIQETYHNISHNLNTFTLNDDNTSLIENLFYEYIPEIKKRLHIQEKMDTNDLLFNIIDWCIENSMVIQATLLFSENYQKIIKNQNVLNVYNSLKTKNNHKENNRFEDQVQNLSKAQTEQIQIIETIYSIRNKIVHTTEEGNQDYNKQDQARKDAYYSNVLRNYYNNNNQYRCDCYNKEDYLIFLDQCMKKTRNFVKKGLV